jgi:hypothetical protein
MRFMTDDRTPSPEPSIEDIVRQVIDAAVVDTRLGHAAFEVSPEGIAAVIESSDLDDLLHALTAAISALIQVATNLGAEMDRLRARVADLEGRQ